MVTMTTVSPLSAQISVSEKAKASLVAIKAGSAFGSGIILNTQGDVVTNYHVIKGATKITILTQHKGACGIPDTMGKCYKTDEVNIKAVNSIWDLAILNIHTFKGYPAGTKPVDKIQGISKKTIIPIEHKIYALGYPLAHDLKSSTITNGIISGRNRAGALFRNRFTDNTKNDHALLRFDARVDVGSSGGMLLNEDGDVVAVVTGAVGKREFLGFAVPIQYVNRLLQTKPENTKPFEGYNWSIHDNEGDTYYSSKLYADVSEPKDSFDIVANVIDTDSENVIHNAAVLLTEGDPPDQRYKRLLFTDHQGLYQTTLPNLTDQAWYISIQHKDYDKIKLGPFKRSNDFPKEISMQLREKLRNKLDAVIFTNPSKIGLNKGYGEIEYNARVYKGGALLPDKIVKWEASSQSHPSQSHRWLVIKPPLGVITSGSPSTTINLIYNKNLAIQAKSYDNTTLTLLNTVDDTSLPKRFVTVYADKLPRSKSLQVSGFLLLEGNERVKRPVSIGATVDGVPINFQAIAKYGRFETFIDRNKYAQKDIKLEIESNTYEADENDPNLIINAKKDWHTKIKLKRREQ